MKWNKPPKEFYRIIRRFLIIPKEINGEYRWLELAYIQQKEGYYSERWHDNKWSTEEEFFNKMRQPIWRQVIEKKEAS